MNKKIVFVALVIVSLVFGLFEKAYSEGNSSAQKTEDKEIILPEYLGIYAISEGKLIELNKIPQSASIGFGGIAGSDVIKNLSSVSFNDGNIQFIVYNQSAATQSRLVAKKLARLRKQISGNQITDLYSKNWYVVSGESLRIKIAPISQNPNMMIRGVPEKPFTPGFWALEINDELYDFKIEGEVDFSENCMDRIVAMFEVTYKNCNSGYGENLERSGKEREEASEKYLVVKKSTSIRIKPAILFSDPITTVEEGTTVEQLDDSNPNDKSFGWYKVKLPSGEVGWIQKIYVKTK